MTDTSETEQTSSARAGPTARRWRRVLVAAVVLLAAGCALAARFLLPGAALVWSLADGAPAPAPVDGAWVETEVGIEARDARILRARVYRPIRIGGRAMVLIHGAHVDGIEGRVRTSARKLAALGHPVITPEIPDLRAFTLAPRSVDDIEDATRWAAAHAREALASEGYDGRVGLCGVSVAGGYALIAAGRPGVTGDLAFVLSLGGHADLDATLAYLCGTLVEPGSPEPHIYAVAMVLRHFAERVVPRDQVDPLRAALGRFLTDDLEGARVAAEGLLAPGRELFDHCLAWRVQDVGCAVAPVLAGSSFAAALSPVRSPPARVPVFLLHGRYDNIVPASHADELASYLRPHTEVSMVISDLVDHVDLQRRTLIELLRLSLLFTDVRRR